ncbi:MAG: ATP-binding protein [Firmicutes bacterium]|nr:ATP-binding protein [Bacillota bacterium]
MKTSWFHSVQVRTIVILILASLFILSTGYYVIQDVQIKDRVNNRISEINRYAVAVAADISMNQYLDKTSSASAYNEVDSMAGFFPEARILVLSANCRVQKDSNNRRRGRTVINDDILAALSGTNAQRVEQAYVRIAVPIRAYKKDVVQGVVYVTADMQRQYQQSQRGLDTILITSILSFFSLLVVIILTVILSYRPLHLIREWLHQVLNGHNTRPPMVRDRSEYGELVQSMDSIITDLKDADNSRREFVSNVSHELKTPLSSIKVLTESLLLQEDAPVEEYRDFLQDINSEIDRESALINDLLSLVRLEDSSSGLNLSMVSVNDLAETVLKRLQPLADNRHIALILENRSQVTAEMDEMKMSIALSNLVENGIKYNKEGGNVRISVDQDFADAVIAVSDTGIGIPQEHLNKIFQRFYRVDKTRDRATGGTGLGLAIVHQIVTMHHGSINVRSQVDNGTVFIVRIPLIALRGTETNGGEQS